MAKKDKKDEEYKDENIHNEPEQDDEDFGLPDLDDNDDDSESSNDFDSGDDTSANDDSEIETSFDTSETTEDTFSSEQDEEYDPNPFGDDDEEPISTYTPPKKQSAAPIIITLSIIVLIACGLVYYFFLREPNPEPVVEKEPVKDTTSYVVEKPVESEPEVIEPKEPVEGVVSTLNSRTGRSYVVVGSFFDEDLAKDYADKLSNDGTNAYIIPPFGKSKFNRVAIEETESFAAASTRATELAGQFKEQPWPLKY